MKVLFWILFVLAVIGGLNWGLVGFFNIDVVTLVLGTVVETGEPTFYAKIVYDVIGVSSLFLLVLKIAGCKY
jgi:uncharacterized membrane protein YuzA (DUF378 family)